MLFASKCKQQRVVLRPTIKVFAADGFPIIRPGVTVEFMNGIYETDDTQIIEMLLRCPTRGLDFLVVDDEEAKAFIARHHLNDVPVITGARSTRAPQVIPDDLSQVKPARTHNEVTSEPNVKGAAPGVITPIPWNTPESSEAVKPVDLDALIAKKLEGILPGIVESVIMKVSERQPDPIPEQPKPKKKFTCRICGEIFDSGIAVGAHKLQMHSSVV